MSEEARVVLQERTLIKVENVFIGVNIPNWSKSLLDSCNKHKVFTANIGKMYKSYFYVIKVSLIGLTCLCIEPENM